MSSKRQTLINQFRNNFSQAAWQELLGFLRLMALVGFVLTIGIFGATNLDKVSPADIAEGIRNANPLLQNLGWIGRAILVAFAAVLNPNSMRYMIAPFSAILFVIFSAAFYVKDIYALPRFRDALQYVIASLFAVEYPVLGVDKGEAQVDPKRTNLINEIGGPGYVNIEPGNAAIFNTIYEPTGVGVNTTYFLSPFETIARVVNLDEQQINKEAVDGMTRDGIQVQIKDMHIRYRIRPIQENGRPVSRRLDKPYPFSSDAMQSLAFNVSVTKDGPETWEATISRIVISAITDFISSNTIDYLTAPGSNMANPRLELRNELLFRDIKKSLADNGAELLWIDVGHLHIVKDEVDEERMDLWAAPWIGKSNEAQAYAEATHQAYQELGRAEAQAEIIIGIMSALREVSVSSLSPRDVGRLVLARTSLMLDNWNKREMGSSGNPPEKP